MPIPIGVTTKKNIIPIIKGDINFPSNNPNLNHSLFKGTSNFEFIKPRIRNIIEIINDQILKSLPFKSGYSAINKKTIKNTIPKLLFDPIFTSSMKNF
tara:strand:+ start:83 stop:376 length:294 start_codon:yes stop_codon:yes gene_type:complete